MNKRFLGVLMFALAVALVASTVVYRLVESRLATMAARPKERLLVASRELPVGTMLSSSDVKYAAWQGDIPPQAVTKVEDIAGRGVTANIYPGEPVLETRLAVKERYKRRARPRPSRKAYASRGCTPKVNDFVGVAGFVVPGMRVDVLISGLPPNNARSSLGTQTRTILQNIQVLSAGQNIQKDAEGKPVTVPVVNLLVTPEQAETLSLASNETKIQLVLRNPLDMQQAKAPGTAIAYLFGDQRNAPVKTVYAPRAVPRPAAPGSRDGACRRTGDHGSHPWAKERDGSGGAKICRESCGGEIEGDRAMRRVLGCVVALWAGVAAAQTQNPPKDLTLGVGKSMVLDSPADVRRVSVGNPEVLKEAVGVSTHREVLVSGKSAGETTVIVWQESGNRLLYNVTVGQPDTRAEIVRQELARELPGQDVSFVADKDAVFLHGTVTDLTSAGRAMAIASALGKTVNLLHVKVPPGDAQILLKVRFANVDRSVGSQLGLNLFSTGAGNTIGSLGTEQFSPPNLSVQGSGKSAQTGVSLSDALNLFLYRPDINLGATIRALQTNNLLEILAEPNLLALDGKEASFLAGGEFPYPTVQGGSAGGVVAITIQFREFGIKLHFTPTVTPRGTIHLRVAPEVSSLDFANGLVYQGFSIPALDTRRMQTEIELESGQSFAIAGLLDNQVTETLSKVPGLGDIPFFGKFFQSRLLNRSKTELLVIVTPELVRPIPAGQPTPMVDTPKEFMKDGPQEAPRTPGLATTGPVPVKPARETMAVEELMDQQKASQDTSAPAATVAPATPIPVTPVAPAQPPAEAAAKSGDAR